jgi:hypothetical protein
MGLRWLLVRRHRMDRAVLLRMACFGPTATLKVVRTARRWNIGILVGMGTLACGLAALAFITGSPVGLLGVLPLILLVGVPAVLNVRGLRSRIVELAGITPTSQPREQATASP